MTTTKLSITDIDLIARNLEAVRRIHLYREALRNHGTEDDTCCLLSIALKNPEVSWNALKLSPDEILACYWQALELSPDEILSCLDAVYTARVQALKDFGVNV